MLKFYEGGGKIFSFNPETREFFELKEIGVPAVTLTFAGASTAVFEEKSKAGRVKRTWTKMTPEIIAEIQRLKSNGIKSKGVARMLKISHGAVNRHWTVKEQLPPEEN
jgi:hypothetical protein